MTTVGWGAVILGDADDLRELKERFDSFPWVEPHNGEIVFRAPWLDELETADEVRDRAILEIDRLNGALALFSLGARPIRFGNAVIRFVSDGTSQKTHCLEATTFVNRSRFMEHAIGVMGEIGPDGQPIPPPPPPPPQPSEVQRWAMLADDWLSDALTYFGKNDWFDIYKAFECVEKKFGPTPREFLKRNWAEENEIERFKRTANWVARHARRKFNRPPKPMELQEARQFVGDLLRRALKAKDAGLRES